MLARASEVRNVLSVKVLALFEVYGCPHIANPERPWKMDHRRDYKVRVIYLLRFHCGEAYRIRMGKSNCVWAKVMEDVLEGKRKRILQPGNFISSRALSHVLGK